MNRFISNFQSPVEIEDLIDRYENGEVTNLDLLLDYENNLPVEWTVYKESRVGDKIYFMCAKTSKDHMGHVCVQAKEESQEIYEFAERERALYKKYAGKIIAVGILSEDAFQSTDVGWEHPYWRSPWYAEIDEFQLLDYPIDISEFRDFITVSRTGAITLLSDEQSQKLDMIIENKNHMSS